MITDPVLEVHVRVRCDNTISSCVCKVLNSDMFFYTMHVCSDGMLLVIWQSLVSQTKILITQHMPYCAHITTMDMDLAVYATGRIELLPWYLSG